MTSYLNKLNNPFFVRSLLFFFLFPFLGYVISIIIDPVYESKVIFITENAVNTPTDITNLASIAGINLNKDQDLQIKSNIYPLIIEDINFKRKVLNMKVDSINSYKMFLNNIYSFDNNINDTNILKNSLINDSLYINVNEKDYFKFLDFNYYLDVDEFNGYVTITSKSINPNISYLLSVFIYNKLQSEVMTMHLNNKKEILDLNRINLDKKRKEYEKFQKELSLFKDQNINIASNLYLSELKKIENKVNLSYSVYTNLSNLHEQLKLEISKYAPIFTVVLNPYVPYKKSFPNTFIFISFSIFIGFIAVLIYNFYINPDFRIFWNKKIKYYLNK
tara:strand:- start:14527 stop:15525 length:999 start_codon:yes stop_codon:yes gene_type:complete